MVWCCFCCCCFNTKMVASEYSDIYIYDLVPKGEHPRGYALQLKIKHCWKQFLFEMLCTCMNEWIYSTDNFSNQAVVDFMIQSSHTEKALKNDHQKRTSMYEWFSSLCLQTNHKHMEKQSLICTRKTSFYMIIQHQHSW